MSKIFMMMVLTGALSVAGSKDKDWQIGKVLDPIYNPYFGDTASGNHGSHSSPFGQAYQVNNPSSAMDSVSDTYVIETDELVYRVERVRLKASTEAKVKKYNKIRFAIDNKKLWIEDADGKQWTAKIINIKTKS